MLSLFCPLSFAVTFSRLAKGSFYYLLSCDMNQLGQVSITVHNQKQVRMITIVRKRTSKCFVFFPYYFVLFRLCVISIQSCTWNQLKSWWNHRNVPLLWCNTFCWYYIAQLHRNSLVKFTFAFTLWLFLCNDACPFLWSDFPAWCLI